MAINPPLLLAVCKGAIEPLLIRNHDDPKQMRSVMSGIRKSVSSHPDQPEEIVCGPMGLEGDEQADLTVHGGLDKAIYCYPFEHYRFWTSAFPWLNDRPSLYGQVGENLCLQGIAEHEIFIGDQLRIGPEVCLQVTKPREPCYKFNAKMRSSAAAKLMAQEGLCGWYCRVLTPGKLRASDAITVIAGPRDISVAEQYRLLMRS